MAPLAPGDPPRTVWEDRALVPTPRIAYAVAALDGCVHVLGGLGAGSSHEVYDPSSDTWYRAADLPVSTNHAWAAAAGGHLYLGDGGSRRVFRYDRDADDWPEVSPSPVRHGDTPAVGVIAGRICVAGGSGEGMTGSELSVYDPEEEAWTVGVPTQCPRNHTAGGVIDGRFHVVGGRPGVQPCHEAYDPAHDRWTRLADLPTGREGMAAAVVGGLLFVIGGEGNPDDPHFLFDAVEAYDPERDEWMELDPMPNPRHGTFAAAVGRMIFLPGGGRMLQRSPVNDALVVDGEGR